MIEVILWDVDGTLLNFLKAEKASIDACFARFGIGKCTDEMMKNYSAYNRLCWQRLERGEVKKQEMLIDRFAHFLDMYGLDSSIAEEFNAEYQIQLGKNFFFEDGAEETLKALEGKKVQCVVTNGTKVAQVGKLEGSGLIRFFEKLYISEDIGAEKPSSEFFDRVLDDFKAVPKDRILIVGDSLTSDIKGGVDAGIRTCWFNPGASANDKAFTPDYEIKKLTEVLDIVK